MRKISVFGGEIFNIFEQACFRNQNLFTLSYSYKQTQAQMLQNAVSDHHLHCLPLIQGPVVQS